MPVGVTLSLTHDNGCANWLPSLLQPRQEHITSRKALIYALEVFTQLMAALTLARRLPNDWFAFIDNTAGEAALRKGDGKDPFDNGMLAAFWGRQLNEDGGPSSKGWTLRPTSQTPFAEGTFPERSEKIGHGHCTTAITDILTQSASDTDYAAHQAVHDLENGIN